MTAPGTEQEITRRLYAGESLLWSGFPRQGFALRKSDLVHIPFSLIFGGFVIAWEIKAFQPGAPLFAVFWGVPFVFAGLYFLVGRFWVDARMRSGTAYGLTDRRSIIVSGLFSPSVT